MRGPTATSFVPLALVVLVLGLGCASAPATPGDTLAAYALALRDGRYADAWSLLTVEARRDLPYDAFERLAHARPDEVRDAILAYEHPAPRQPITAHLVLETGETVDLLYEGGRWRLDPAALEFYGQHTPRQALRSFVRALVRQRWDVLLHLAPRRIAERMTPDSLRAAWTGRAADDVQSMLDGMRVALDRGAPVEEAGDRATFTYGPGGRSSAQLLREDGRWTLERTE